MIKTFLFDLGNVFLFFSHERMWAQMAAVTGLTPTRVQTLLTQDRLQWRYEAGEVTTDALVEIFQKESSVAFSPASLLHAASDIFTPNTAMLPVAKALKALGHRLVVVSNTNEAHIAFARPRYECFRYFDAEVYSYVVGAMKPDLAYYQAAVAAADAAATACLFVDDLPENVDGARRSGIAGVLFTGAEAFVEALAERGISI